MAVIVAVLLALFLLADLATSKSARIEWYSVSDPRTLDVVVLTGPGYWTRVTGVHETATTVTIDIGDFRWPLPGTAVATYLHLTVPLSAPLGNRTVFDGTGAQATRKP